MPINLGIDSLFRNKKRLLGVRERVFDLSPSRKRWGAVRTLSTLFFIGIMAVQAGDTNAQQGPNPFDQLQNISPDRLRQMLGGQNAPGNAGQDQGLDSRLTILE